MENALIPQTDRVDAKAMSAVEQAKALTITTNEDFSRADSACVALKELEKEIISTFDDPKTKAWAAHKAIVAAEAKHLVPVIEARKIYKGKMAEWANAQEATRREEENRLRIEAQKAADAEALRQAEQAQAEGNVEEAEAIIQAPVYVAPVVVAKYTPKASTVIRKVWDFRVVNPALVPRQYLKVDEVALRKQAQATGQAVVVPGVEFFQRPC